MVMLLISSCAVHKLCNKLEIMKALDESIHDPRDVDGDVTA